MSFVLINCFFYFNFLIFSKNGFYLDIIYKYLYTYLYRGLNAFNFIFIFEKMVFNSILFKLLTCVYSNKFLNIFNIQIIIFFFFMFCNLSFLYYVI